MVVVFSFCFYRCFISVLMFSEEPPICLSFVARWGGNSAKLDTQHKKDNVDNNGTDLN